MAAGAQVDLSKYGAVSGGGDDLSKYGSIQAPAEPLKTTQYGPLAHLSGQDHDSPVDPKDAEALKAVNQFKADHPYVYGTLKALFNDATPAPEMMNLPGSAPAVLRHVLAAVKGAASAVPEQAGALARSTDVLHKPLKVIPDFIDAAKGLGEGARRSLADLHYESILKGPSARWAGEDALPQSEPFDPIPAMQTPSGRVPGSILNQGFERDQPLSPRLKLSNAESDRIALWQKLKALSPEAPPQVVEPAAPAALPSGRIPGKPAFDTSTGQMLSNIGGGEFQAPASPVNTSAVRVMPAQPVPAQVPAAGPPASMPAPAEAGAIPPNVPASPVTATPQATIIPFSKETPPAETFKAAARADRTPKVELMARHLNESGITPEQVDAIQPGKWRDIADSLKIDLPKALDSTIRDVKARLGELKSAKPTFEPSPALQEALKKPGAMEAARKLAEAMK